MSASSFWITECHFTVLRDIPLNPFLTLHHQHRDAGCSLSSREQRGHLRRAPYCSGVDACFCAMQLCFSELILGSNTAALHPPATSINVSACPLHGMLNAPAAPAPGPKRIRECDTVKDLGFTFELASEVVTDSPDPLQFRLFQLH